LKLLDRITLVSSVFGILTSAIVMFVAIAANIMDLALVAFLMIVVLLIIAGGTIRRLP